MHSEYFLNRQVQLALYSLKRQYGGSIVVFHILTSTTDPKTGVPSATYRAFRIGRAIILPARISREVARNISLISANKQMVMGGGIDTSKRTFIIDRRDARQLELVKDDFLVYDGHKYALETIDEYEFATAYVVVAKRLVGASFDATALVQSLNADDTLTLTSTSNGEV